MQLLPDQAHAIESLSRLKVGALFMEPGTGKTRASLELVWSANPDYILWLTPYQTQDNLRAELAKWGGEGVEVCGIETLSTSARAYLDLYSAIERAKRPFIVVDESIKIKNWGAMRTKRINELGRMVEYKLILNGTPITRNLLDVWAQMEFLSPKILNMGMAEFRNTFCEWVRVVKELGGKKSVQEWIVAYHNVDYLYSLIRPYIHEAELDLMTGRQYHRIPYTVTAQTREAYAQYKARTLDKCFTDPNGYIEITQHLQHIYAPDGEKFMSLKKLVSSIGADGTLVVCKFRVSSDMASQIPGIRVLTYGMHSHGLNLQDYDKMIFFDKTFDYGQRLQMERRIYRTGQANTCRYYDMDGDVGLENVINKNIQRKCDLLTYINKVGHTIKDEL
jgi:hypothetical protein